MPKRIPKFGLKVTFTWEVGYHSDTDDLLREEARKSYGVDDVVMVTVAKVSEDPVANLRRALEMMGDFKPSVIYVAASDKSCATIQGAKDKFTTPIVRVRRRVVIDTSLM